jgi:hypothetical protein
MMKRFAVILAGAAAGAAAVVWWRRRTGATAPAPVQLGLADGSTVALEVGDPAAATLVASAEDVRRAFATGA